MQFANSDEFRQNNCKAVDSTNGFNYYDESTTKRSTFRQNPADKFRQAPMPTASEERKHLLNVMLDLQPQTDVVLPPGLTPGDPLPGSASVVQFHMLDDKKTGVLALGSFSGDSFNNLQENLLTGLQNLKDQGATQLIVDIVSA